MRISPLHHDAPEVVSETPELVPQTSTISQPGDQLSTNVNPTPLHVPNNPNASDGLSMPKNSAISLSANHARGITPTLSIPTLGEVNLNSTESKTLLSHMVPSQYQKLEPLWYKDMHALSNGTMSIAALEAKMTDRGTVFKSASSKKTWNTFLNAFSAEAGIVLGNAGPGGELGLRIDIKKLTEMVPERSRNRSNFGTWLLDTVALQGFIGLTLYSANKMGVDETWREFTEHNGGPHFDMAGGEFSWKDGNFGDWIANGVGHPLIFYGTTEIYKKQGHGPLAAWFGTLATNIMFECFWEHYEKTPGVSGHDFFLMNGIIGPTFSALSEEILGEGNRAGLAVHAGVGGSMRRYNSMMEAYVENGKKGHRYSVMWSPNYIKEPGTSRKDVPYMPYDFGLRFTDLNQGFYVAANLNMNNTAKEFDDFKTNPIKGFELKAGFTIDLDKGLKKLFK
jgi:hypothetical protein